MIILEFAGGLGNQMFQYGLYKRLCNMGRDVKCIITNDDKSYLPFKLDVFPNISFDLADYADYKAIKNRYLNRGYSKKIINKLFPLTTEIYYENEYKKIDNNIFRIDKCILSGYFQGLDYIRPIEDILRDDFVFPIGEEKLMNIIQRLPQNSVSIHIRRGDYLTYSNIYGGICTEQYYKKAIDFFIKRGIKHFVVFSNDINWVKNNIIIKNAIYVDNTMFDHYQDWYDMCIMSKCTHNIIANSTFSWWGAWLNNNRNKIVITPPYFENLHKYKNLIDDNWTIIKG